LRLMWVVIISIVLLPVPAKAWFGGGRAQQEHQVIQYEGSVSPKGHDVIRIVYKKRPKSDGRLLAVLITKYLANGAFEDVVLYGGGIRPNMTAEQVLSTAWQAEQIQKIENEKSVFEDFVQSSWHEFAHLMFFTYRAVEAMDQQVAETEALVALAEEMLKEYPKYSPEWLALNQKIIDTYYALAHELEHGVIKTILLSGLIDSLMYTTLMDKVLGLFVKLITKVSRIGVVSRTINGSSQMTAGLLQGIKARLSMGPEAVKAYIRQMSSAAYQKLPQGAKRIVGRVQAKAATNKGEASILSKVGVRGLIGRFAHLRSGLKGLMSRIRIAERVAASPKLATFLEHYFPVHQSFHGMVIPMLKRNLIWKLSAELVSQYNLRGDQFFEQFDAVLQDMTVTTVFTVIYAPFDVFPGSSSVLKQYLRRIPGNFVYSLGDAAAARYRMSGLEEPTAEQQEYLQGRAKATIVYGLGPATNQSRFVSRYMVQINQYRNMNPQYAKEAALVEFVYRAAVAVYGGTIKLFAREQIAGSKIAAGNPAKELEQMLFGDPRFIEILNAKNVAVVSDEPVY
jgi:hypothetical protein